jgi:hypothetical protein
LLLPGDVLSSSTWGGGKWVKSLERENNLGKSEEGKVLYLARDGKGQTGSKWKEPSRSLRINIVFLDRSPTFWEESCGRPQALAI